MSDKRFVYVVLETDSGYSTVIKGVYGSEANASAACQNLANGDVENEYDYRVEEWMFHNTDQTAT